VLVLEDVSSRGFRTFDTALLLFDFDHLKVSVGGLAEFHALAIAHDLMSKQKLVIYFKMQTLENISNLET
jgi:hypothetical protein